MADGANVTDAAHMADLTDAAMTPAVSTTAMSGERGTTRHH